jgi:hypothetical protein
MIYSYFDVFFPSKIHCSFDFVFFVNSVKIGDKMEQQRNRSSSSNKIMKKRKNKLMRCCSCSRRAASCMFKGIERCVFVTCYPIVQCFDLDEHKHHHHGKHFDW